MRQIFSNAAVTELTAPITPEDLTIYLADTTNFPKPVVGEEFYIMTLVGECSSKVELVMVGETCDDCVKVLQRGLQNIPSGVSGTIAQAFSDGDQAYHSLDAFTVQRLVEIGSWFLGPFSEPPVNDWWGNPVREGHHYWNTVFNILFFWDGDNWVPPYVTLGANSLAQYHWVIDVDRTAPYLLPWPDVYGLSPTQTWDPLLMGVELLVNGTSVVQELDPLILEGDYTVDYENQTITVLMDLKAGDVVVANLSVSSEPLSDTEYVRKDDTDPTPWSWTTNDPTYPEANDNLIPTQGVVRSMMNARLRWRGGWIAQTYQANDVVRDGNWLMVANKETSDRAAPNISSTVEDGITDDSGLVTVSSSSTTHMQIGNDFTFSQEGVVNSVRIQPDPAAVAAGVRFHLAVWTLGSGAGAVLIYKISGTDLDDLLEPSGWTTVPIPGGVVVGQGTILGVRLTHTVSTAAAISHLKETGRWNSAANLPAFCSAVTGIFAVDNQPPTGVGDCYACDVQFQDADSSPDWDVMALSGGSGSGSSGGGETHWYSTAQPTNDLGRDGDIWFIPE